MKAKVRRARNDFGFSSENFVPNSLFLEYLATPKGRAFIAAAATGFLPKKKIGGGWSFSNLVFNRFWDEFEALNKYIPGYCDNGDNKGNYRN